MTDVASFRPLRLQSNRRITDPDSVPRIARAPPCSAIGDCCATTIRLREDARMRRIAVNSDRSKHSVDHQSDIGNWKRTLDRLVYFVRLSGVPPALIQRQFRSSIRRYRSIRQARVPPTHQLAYPRVLARWKDDRTFLDGRGRPRALRYDGPEPNFKTLVEGALPDADPADVLASFKRHRIVSQDPNGAITVLRDMFVPAGPRLGWDIYIVLVSLQ